MVVSRFTENNPSYREDAVSNLRSQHIDGESSICETKQPQMGVSESGVCPQMLINWQRTWQYLSLDLVVEKALFNFSWSIQQVGIGHTSKHVGHFPSSATTRVAQTSQVHRIMAIWRAKDVTQSAAERDSIEQRRGKKKRRNHVPLVLSCWKLLKSSLYSMDWLESRKRCFCQYGACKLFPSILGYTSVKGKSRFNYELEGASRKNC